MFDNLLWSCETTENLANPVPRAAGHLYLETEEPTLIQFFPNPQRLPVLVSGPVQVSPSNKNDIIVSRETYDLGRHGYHVEHRVGDQPSLRILVSPEDILDHVSAAELERFEITYAREQRREEDERSAKRRARRALRLNRANSDVQETDELSASGGFQAGLKTGSSSPREEKRRLMKRATTSIAAATPKKRAQKATKSDRPSSDSSRDAEYEVEAIVDDVENNGQRLYFVKWLGYPEEDNTWLPEDSLHAPRLLRKYHQAMMAASNAKLSDDDAVDNRNPTEELQNRKITISGQQSPRLSS